MVIVLRRTVVFTAAVTLLLRTVTGRIIPWEKFIYRKFKSFEDITWVLCSAIRAAAASAFLNRHADIICRHQQLNIPFQTDNGKLPQCDIQLAHAVIQNDIIAKHTAQ